VWILRGFFVVISLPRLSFYFLYRVSRSTADDQFKISWDKNNDGVFNETDGDVVDDPNWHFRFVPSGGKFKRARGNMQGKSPSGEGGYFRIDEFWIQPHTLVTFESMSDAMTARRRWIHSEEVKDFKANGNVPKVNVRVLKIDHTGFTPVVEVRDRVVTPHNHRSDVYQDGVLTIMDALLSVPEAEVKFGWWGTLSTGAVVDHFAISSVIGIKSTGMAGWGLMQMTPSLETITNIPDYGFMLKDFQLYPNCLFDENGATLPKEQVEKILSKQAQSPIDRKTCLQDWTGAFGGGIVHVMPDAHPLTYGHLNILLMSNDLGPQFGLSLEKDNLREGDKTRTWDLNKDPEIEDLVTLQTFNLPEQPVGKAPILNETHFGWKVADCTLCHSEEKTPKGHGGFAWPVNSADGFDEVQPYYCATCHGSNGAPASHGELDRCFWCHSNDGIVPKNHNEASTVHRYLDTDERPLDGNIAYKTSPAFRTPGIPADDWGNHKPVKETWDSKNNDWDISAVFPDPYSCLTCHPQNPSIE